MHQIEVHTLGIDVEKRYTPGVKQLPQKSSRNLFTSHKHVTTTT